MINGVLINGMDGIMIFGVKVIGVNSVIINDGMFYFGFVIDVKNVFMLEINDFV